jgi:hypothetical protein
MYFVGTHLFLSSHHMIFFSILSYAFFQINKYHIYVILLFLISLPELSYQENRLHCEPPKHKTKLIFGDSYQFF